jgi:RNA polymerase-binding transcription factor DksA
MRERNRVVAGFARDHVDAGGSAGECTGDSSEEGGMTKDELAYFERRLLDERARVADVLRRGRADAGDEEARDQAGDLSAFPFHPADLGTDEMQRELDDVVASREAATLAEIDAALERLYRTPERFGVDERTGAPIPHERLDLIPWARTGAGAGGGEGEGGGKH